MIAILPSNPAAAAAATNTPTFFDKKALNTSFVKQVSSKAACSAGTNDGDFSGEWFHWVEYSNTKKINTKTHDLLYRILFWVGPVEK
jgi:hypothetical protein